MACAGRGTSNASGRSSACDGLSAVAVAVTWCAHSRQRSFPIKMTDPRFTLDEAQALVPQLQETFGAIAPLKAELARAQECVQATRQML